MKTFENTLNDDQRAEYPKVSDTDATYPDGYKITCIFTKKLDGDWPESERVSLCYEIDYSGVPIHKGARKDPHVTAQRGLKDSFETTEDLRTFAQKYAQPDDPYKVHFNKLGAQIVTPEQRKAEREREVEQMSNEERAVLRAKLRELDERENE